MPSPLKLFIAYSRHDSDFLNNLLAHLTPLKRNNQVSIWYDGLMQPGAEWGHTIKENLRSADVILLLVSADALYSDNFYQEMTDALERHDARMARVVPLILRPCTWKETRLCELQALPKDAKPVSTWPNQDEAYKNAVDSLRAIASNSPGTMGAQPGGPEPPGLIARLRSPKPWGIALGILALAFTGNQFWNEKPIGLPLQQAALFSKLTDPFEAEMVFIPGGTFDMGSNEGEQNEGPMHQVAIPDFYMGKTEVTQAQWQAVMGEAPRDLYFKACEDCPVEGVSWEDVQQFIEKLNQISGKTYRLPSEAEWEFAARGGNASRKTKYAGSNRIQEVAWYNTNSGNKTHPVGKKEKNESGLYDMSGNIWEWCGDMWHENYEGAPLDGSAWTGGDPDFRVARGGSWSNYHNYCRNALRSRLAADNRDNNIGFRLAR